VAAVTWFPGCEAVALFLQITDGELPGAMRLYGQLAREQRFSGNHHLACRRASDRPELVLKKR
jgi:hypothetical protein